MSAAQIIPQEAIAQASREVSYRGEPVYADSVTGFRRPRIAGQVKVFRHSGTLFNTSIVDVQQSPQQVAIAYIRNLAQRLCEVHPDISTYQGVFGGFPHIKGVRFSVADVLSQIYVLGSLDEVEKAFAPDISKEQIKEAIAYAQDFMEATLCP
jgi:uncharacterized protein (DUF433 family)